MANDKNTPVTNVALKSDAKVSTGEELSFFQKIKLERERQSTLVFSVEDYVNKLAVLDETVALQYHDLYETIKPVDEDDEWRPILIAIASKKGNEEALDNAGAGGLYYHDTKIAVPSGTLFFPLHVHTEHTWWGDGGKAMCKSIDGLRGNRFTGPGAPGIFKCGSETCPNVPDRFQKSVEPCKFSRTLYLTDDKFSNIYMVSLRYHSIKDFYEMVHKNTKQGGTKFSPHKASWWNVRTQEIGTDQKKGWYYKAVLTDSVISEPQELVINQLKILVKSWHMDQVDGVKAKVSKGDQAIETIEVESGSVDTGEDSEDYTEI